MPKDTNTGEKLASSIKLFTEKRRKQVYDSLNEVEEERFNAFRESFGRMNKVVAVSASFADSRQFIQNLPGAKPKISLEVA